MTTLLNTERAERKLRGGHSPFENCRLCPRKCGVDRVGNQGQKPLGFCGESHVLRVAYVGCHFGEEPPITGENGSGTVFFSGCTLKCTYCQNHQISTDGLGRVTTVGELFTRVRSLIDAKGVHNINLVTPDHFFPHAFQLVSLIRETGYTLPVVYNLSGFQAPDMLKKAEPYADIYLPDFKYSDSALSQRLSRCKDYPETALAAIAEMIRQKGFLDPVDTDAGPAKTGVLVRHLILPGKSKNSIDALTMLFIEFGAKLPLSLMSQYTPLRSHTDPDLNRPITWEEFETVYAHAVDLGFESLYVQFPEKRRPGALSQVPFVPDFRRAEPFSNEAVD
jgi:putative pyruvate formate lyase activating enzyme